MTHKLETIEGKISEVEEKTTKTDKPMFVIHIDGKRISGFGPPPKAVKEAYQAKDRVLIDYAVSEKGFWNYKNCTRAGALEEEVKKRDEESVADKKEFKTGDDIPPADNPLIVMQDAAAKIGHHAREAFKEIYGQYPDITKDGQCAIVNTLSIFMSQCSLMSKFKMSKPGTSLEELMKNGN